MIWRVEHFVEIDSTNAWLVQRARAGGAEGLVALADFQTAGRGRLERQWVSPPGTALLCSLLFRPELDADELHLVVAAVALAARAALVRLSGVRPALKWPNDLMVGDAKLAGLLAEVVTTEQGLAVVVGIGINLTESPDDARSTNVRDEAGITLGARALLDIVLDELEPRRAQFDSDEGRVALGLEYERALVTLGQRVRVERLADVVVGEARRVDCSGRLIVDVDGVEVTISVGDVLHVRPDTDEAR